MSRRLAINRLSRSASSITIVRSSTRTAGSRRGVQIAQHLRRAEHRGERGLQIVRDRGQQSLPQPVGLGIQTRLVDLLDQVHALDGQRALINQGVEEALLFRRQNRPRLVGVDSDHADDATPGAHRQEQALGARQRIGAATRRPVVVEGPLGGRDVGLVDSVLGRVAGLHGDAARTGQEDDRRAPSASTRSGRRSPTARRRACRSPPVSG